VAGEEAADRAIAEGHAFVGERLAQLFDRQVGRRFEKSEDRVFVRLDPSRPAVSALGTGARFAPLALERAPPAHARGAHPETFAGLPMA
jgi:hypothetical protein